MYCPTCMTPNFHNVKRCGSCGADLEGLPKRVFVGSQFLFVDASERRPVVLAVDGAEPQRYTGPLVLSRHLHDVTLGNGMTQPTPSGKMVPELDLPRLPAPAGPELSAVITDRKIYRPREEVRVLVLAPDLPAGSVEMELQLAGQQISKDRVILDESGMLLCSLADLEEGEYTIVIRRPPPAPAGPEPSGPEPGRAAPSILAPGRMGPRPAPNAAKPVTCTFSVAEFSLSPLVACLEQHSYEPASGQLAFRLSLLALSVPYDGAVELGLQCAESGDRVVEKAKARARDGRVEGAFDVSAYGGPFRIQVTTPGGETATVYIPGSARLERERVTLCPLGHVAEAGLLPGEGTREVRGLHIGTGGEENTPLRLESVVAETGRLRVANAAPMVQIVTFEPSSAGLKSVEFADVQAGAVLEFPVEAPYTLFTAALLGPRLAYEAWGVVVRPVELSATLSAPETALPGAEIAVRVSSDRPAACLLLVYDARLEHESPRPKLAGRLLDAVRAAGGNLKEGAVSPLESMPWGWGGWYGPGGPLLRSGAMPPPMPGRNFPVQPMATALRQAADTGRLYAAAGRFGTESGAQAEVERAATPAAVETEALAWVAVPSREEFPEVAYLELFPVRGAVVQAVRLGDQIGAWRCRAYLVAGLDVEELTADVAVAKPLYAELDLPAIVGEGDDILAAVRYHTPGPATMTITLPNGKSISGAVMGHGLESFHLTEPGEISVHLSGAGGDDWTRRTVSRPGVQAVTASRLEILKMGETISGERVLVYPGPADVLKETIAALGRYPFG